MTGISGSRPTKSQPTPPPLYLTHGDSVNYCHTCGRVVGSRRANTAKAASTEVKYCSERCKRSKPSAAADSLDSRIARALTALLQSEPVALISQEGSNSGEPFVKSNLKPKRKGDPRVIIKLSELETAVFGDRSDPLKTFGRRKNRARRGVPESAEWKSVDMEDEARSKRNGNDDDSNDSMSDHSMGDEVSGVRVNDHVRPSQIQSDVNYSVGGERGWSEKLEESLEMLQKRREGQKRAEEKEVVKRAARRAIVFGLLVQEQPEIKGKRAKGAVSAEPRMVQRKCEALVNGQVVEPSFAKGDWAIRWRED